MKTANVTNDPQYTAMESMIAAKVSHLQGPLFTTDVISLWHMYLNGIPITQRQHYNCSACRRFIDRFGGLVAIDKLGQIHSVFWDEISFPALFKKSAGVMKNAVEQSKVTGVFLNEHKIWGLPQTGAWSHLSGLSNLPIAGTKLKTADQLAAEKYEDFKMLRKAIATTNIAALRQAVRILRANALERSEKAIGVANWLLELQESLAVPRKHGSDALIWLAVAAAPPGYCHINSTMLGTLLDDISSGMDFDVISARWSKKMNPLQYQRPQAQITTGQIDAANKVVEKLSAEGSLQRRFAKLEECTLFWSPTEIIPLAEPVGGAFDHLKRKVTVSTIVLPVIKMTWMKFKNEWLPKAAKIEFLVPNGYFSYYGLVTAVNPLAPPILQWDFEYCRNPVSWYFVAGGSPPSAWSLRAGEWVTVNGMMNRPCHWNWTSLMKHHAEAVFMVLDGCRPSGEKPHQGGSFFPECLRAEFHEIRAAMEAYARTAPVVGIEEATGCGVAIQKGDEFNVRIRVTEASGDKQTFLLDRWE